MTCGGRIYCTYIHGINAAPGPPSPRGVVTYVPSPRSEFSLSALPLFPLPLPVLLIPPSRSVPCVYLHLLAPGVWEGQ